MPTPDYLKICAQEANIPELAQVDTTRMPQKEYEELVGHFGIAAISGLSQNDITAIHPPFEGRKAVLFGETAYNDGVVATGMGAAALKAGPKPGFLRQIQTALAASLDEPSSPLASFNQALSTHIFSDMLTVHDQPIPLPCMPEVVIDYTACLSSKQILADQVRFVAEGHPPFAYVGVTRNHFLNEALVRSYNTHEPGLREIMQQKRLYTGREEGISAAMNAFERSNKNAGVPTNVADIMP